MRSPLNGIKTHPLTAYGWRILEALQDAPMPALSINAGAINRLMREDLAEIVNRPSPYAYNKGKPTSHLQITEAGRKRLAQRP